MTMFRLTREVRFSLNPAPDPQFSLPPTNSYAGHPTPLGFAPYLTLSATLTGPLQPTGYLRNIKDIDHQIRTRALPLFTQSSALSPQSSPPTILSLCFTTLKDAFPPATLTRLTLSLSPFLSYTILAKEHPMTRLSQKFEFSASHRLHNPSLSDAENRAAYGKCNNPHGHGHNYELQVTLLGAPDPATGLLADLPSFERTVASTVLDKFDHKHLNTELPEFATLVPSVENIAMVIYRLLKPHLNTPHTRLASVTVWETPKTFCEYAEDDE